MRFAVLALLLPVFAGAGEGKANEAEKLFRQMEKKIGSARALRIVADVQGKRKRTDEAWHFELALARGNKVWIRGKWRRTAGGLTESGMGEFVSDGARQRLTDSSGGEAREAKEAKIPAGFVKSLTALLARVGVRGALRLSRKWAGEKAPDVDSLLSLGDFRMGEAAKVNGRDARVLHYQVTLAGSRDTAQVTLYLDAKTLLPLRRVIASGGTLTETYTELTLNPKLDPKTFELPK
jgi:outer membrane lipoprotein-sorting protein